MEKYTISKKFAVKFSSMSDWSVSTNFLNLTNRCNWDVRPLFRITKLRSEIANDNEINSGAILLLDRISFEEGKIYAGSRILTKMKQFKSYKGDVVVSKINARKGAIGIIDSDKPVGVTIHFRTLIPDTGLINNRFLWLALRGIFCRNQFEIATGGQGKGEISEARLMDIKVPFPPLTEQQAIVAYWETNKIAASRLILDSDNELRNISRKLLIDLGLKELKLPTINRIFAVSWHNIDRWGVDVCRQSTSKPNVIESKYPAVRLRDVIADLQNGWSPKCYNRQAKDEEWGVLKVGAVSFGFYDESQNKALPDALKPRPQYEVKEGDLIISRANIARLVGACALVKSTRPRLMLCDKIFRVIWKDSSSVMPEYLDEILKLPHLRWQIENNLTGASPTMKNISKPSLLDLKFPLPPLTIQENIVNEIREARNRAQRLERKADMISKEAKENVEKMILGIRPIEGI